MENLNFEEQPGGRRKCKVCGRTFHKTGFGNHFWKVHGAGQDHRPALGCEPWNKGLTKDEDPRIAQGVQTYKERLAKGECRPSFEGRTHTPETKDKISKALSRNNHGGRCKWFIVENAHGEKVKVQGTWERRFSSVLNIIDPDWIKPTLYHAEHSFKWFDDDGKAHTYTPDFWCPRLKKYFEVKGYWWGNDKRKMELVIEQNPHVTIEIIRKKELISYEKLLVT